MRKSNMLSTDSEEAVEEPLDLTEAEEALINNQLSKTRD